MVLNRIQKSKGVKELKKSTEIMYINLYDSYKKTITLKPLEELVKELVAWSMPLTFHIEALKCQSIIMRTRIIKESEKNNTRCIGDIPEVNLSLAEFPGMILLEDYQEIWGEEYERNKEILSKAIDSTEGMIIFFNNKPIDARFHIVCGGSTENSENVYGNVVQYLRRVLCSYCHDTPYTFNYKDLSLDEIEKKLDLKFPREESTKTIEIESMFDDVIRDETGRILQLKVAGRKFQGAELKELLELNSTRFSWKPEKIRFFTTGKGDGMGLCQYGANQMAIEGKKAEEILQYYYTGITIKRMEIKDIKKPLKGKTIMIDAAHGGEKGKGSLGPTGLMEKDVNLDIALYLQEQLQELGAELYMTRKEDKHVSMTERSAFANNILPDFFISIHQNHFKHPNIAGTEIYYYRGDDEAKRLGEEIINEMVKNLGTINRGVKTANFFLLRDIAVSSLHIEVAHISNPNEEVLLMKEEFKKKVALAIANGIVKYYGYLP